MLEKNNELKCISEDILADISHAVAKSNSTMISFVLLQEFPQAASRARRPWFAFSSQDLNFMQIRSLRHDQNALHDCINNEWEV